MNKDLYAECLVKREKAWYVLPAKIALILLDIIALFSCVILSIFGLIILTLAMGATYLIWQMLDLEYEYIFVTSELSIDTIFNKSRRKKAVRIDLSKADLIAPENHGDLKRVLGNPNVKVKDYSSRRADAKKYGIYYSADGSNQVVLIEPTGELLHVMKSYAPRKVIIE
ncbi:MAG: DUF6106 family protein [Lachnospiraceae bacterium]